jgi:hypothetical protein
MLLVQNTQRTQLQQGEKYCLAMGENLGWKLHGCITSCVAATKEYKTRLHSIEKGNDSKRVE